MNANIKGNWDWRVSYQVLGSLPAESANTQLYQTKESSRFLKNRTVKEQKAMFMKTENIMCSVKINKSKLCLKWSQGAKGGSSNTLPFYINYRPNRERSILQLNATLATPLLSQQEEGGLLPPRQQQPSQWETIWPILKTIFIYYETLLFQKL